MASNDNSANIQILRKAKSILLVDWPDTGVPRALINAGFQVYSYSPGSYSIANISLEQPQDNGDQAIFPPANENEKGHLVFKGLDQPPLSVDIVNIYRPEAEFAGIVETHILPLKAKVVWVHPPLMYEKADELAAKHGFILVQGSNIAELAREL